MENEILGTKKNLMIWLLCRRSRKCNSSIIRVIVLLGEIDKIVNF